MRVSTHIYGVSKEIDGKMFIFSKPRHVTSQINCLRKMNPLLRVWTHMYGVSNEIHWKMFICVSFLYIEMKELCEPSVNRTQFIFFTAFPLRWTSPQWVSGVDILADICWTPHSQCLQMISWLTYVWLLFQLKK